MTFWKDLYIEWKNIRYTAVFIVNVHVTTDCVRDDDTLSISVSVGCRFQSRVTQIWSSHQSSKIPHESRVSFAFLTFSALWTY